MVRTNLQEFAGDVHVLSNLQVGSNLFANDLAANVLNVIGSIGANLFVGDGGLLSNIATTLDDIIDQGNTVSNTVIFVSGNDATSNIGIITRSNVGISISNTEPTGEYQLTVGSNIFANTHASNVLSVVGRIGADYFVGDGGLLSNIATTLDQIVDQGNTISNTVILESAQDTTSTSNIGLISRENVGISVSNSNPTGEFQFGVGSNLFVNTYSSNVLTVEGNVLAQKLTFGTATVTSAYNLSHVTAQGSSTDQTISLTNATTGLAVSSNATVGGNVTAETVISTANVEVGDRLKFSGSNVFVDDLRVADVAANLVTYDKTTGELMDSGGLFANKLAVVSVQPPSTLSANTTTIAKHGTYTVTTSSLATYSNAWNAFDGDSAVEWTSSPTNGHLYSAGDNTYAGTSNLFAGNYIQTGVSSAGEWLAIEFPYKTTLRHMKLTPPATVPRYPASANVYATNDSLTWTELTNWSGVDPENASNVQTIIVNATESFKKYALVATKSGGATNVALAKWDLFTESFSIDGGKVEMATSAVMGGETTMDQHGPHGRDGAAVLKKYPEILFDASKLDGNDSTNTYVQAGYTVTASSTYSTYSGWKVFDGVSNVDTSSWYSGDNLYNGGTPVGTGSGSSQLDTNVDVGEYLVITLPFKIKASYALISPRTNGNYSPKSGKFYGYDGNSWIELSAFTNKTYTPGSFTKIDIDSTTFYEKFAIVSTEIAAITTTYTAIGELKLYGYEEDPPAGDTSVDTTFTSIMNTPQTTGANVYVDGNLGETFTNRVTGPTVSNTHTTYVSAGKYWELSGNVESNVTVEANTFLEGDQPHAVSVWFNSSNLEANVSNTCVFSISDQEKLDSVNLDLQSNTWHNLTYAYQGEGGSRVTYLDGRKVAEDQAEDTFGEYPPFAMTGYSQGGYVVSASTEYNTDALKLLSWQAFDNTAGTRWDTANDANYDVNGVHDNSVTTIVDGTSRSGDWIQVEFPHKLRLSYFTLKTTIGVSPNYQQRAPKTVLLAGSNNGTDWVSLFNNTSNPRASEPSMTLVEAFTLSTTQSYKYFRLIALTTFGGEGRSVSISELQYYGHRENDLVRLPDSTRVLKYPHVALSGPVHRGYVASASSVVYDTDGWKAFAPFDNSVLYWAAGLGIYSQTSGAAGGVYNTADASAKRLSTTTDYGEWLKLELPHKIILSKVFISARPSHTYKAPSNFKIYGSNNDSDWYTLLTVTGATPSQSGGNYYPGGSDSDTSTRSSDVTPYKYLAIVVSKAAGGSDIGDGSNSPGLIDAMMIADISYFGTEENSSIPIQIGGGNIDKVANFRVYDKFIGEDQALEIWDAQKDEFGRAKSSMTLHKGRLGIGTTEPEGRLAVADEPHNLEEFPPRGMTDFDTHIEGHGVFTAYASSRLNNSSFKVWAAFDKNINSVGWHDEGTTYTNGVYTGTQSLAGIKGEWIALKLPYAINLKSVAIAPRSGSTLAQRSAGAGVILGSNDEVNWNQLHSFSGLTATDYKLTYINNITASGYYRTIAIVVTDLVGIPATSLDSVNISEIKFFGTREQGQSVLHDGQLTLTKNLTVPRIGPALDADDTPRRDRLVVEYNTSTNPTFEGAVRDTSGRGNDGVLGSVSYDAVEKSFGTFSSGGIKTMATNNLLESNGKHSFSAWIRFDSPGAWEAVYGIGANIAFAGNNDVSVVVGTGVFRIETRTSGPYWSDRNYTFTDGKWVHMVVVYDGTGGLNGFDIYMDTVKLAQGGSTNGTAALNLPTTNLSVHFGQGSENSPTASPTYVLDGAMSSIKFYDTALTAEEVKTLYDMGRCDEGHHVVNFSKTRVGIGLGDGEAPRSALDVRDLIYAESSSVQTFTGQHICFPDESMEKGLIVSAKKNKFVKLNGLATGKSAITIDESLPIVSLSNVAQDKACFGVVSKMEESNAAYRTEITGGLVSESVKIAGDNRAIVNSVGEGAIWVVDTNGPLESGDYITTSNVVGYGQKQDDDILHNYTVAKITMDCDFTGSNVAVQTIKREETGLQTIMEDTWNQLVDYDRSSNTETQYSNTLAPSAYSGQSGYTPREVTTIVDYTDGSNLVSIAEWSNLESNIQNTYQSNTFTEIVDYTKFVNLSEWSNLTTDVQNTYSEAEITTYYQIQRGENVLDENGQLQFEDKTGATEAPYERRFLDASGAQTDSANAVHIAAFVGCTYHCG